MTILGLLQCQWFKDPVRAKRIMETKYAGRHERFVKDFLFFDCTSGRNLRKAFGEDLCERIIWEDVSLQLGGKPGAVFPPNPVHLEAVFRKFQPSTVLTFGRVAERAITEDLARPYIFDWFKLPHPAARGKDTMPALREAGKILRGKLGLEPPGNFLKISSFPFASLPIPAYPFVREQKSPSKESTYDRPLHVRRPPMPTLLYRLQQFPLPHLRPVDR